MPVPARGRDAGGGGAGVVPARVVPKETTAAGRGLRRPRVVRRLVATAVPPVGPPGEGPRQASAGAVRVASAGAVREASAGATERATAAPAGPVSAGAVRAVSAAAVRAVSAPDGVSRMAIVGPAPGETGEGGRAPTGGRGAGRAAGLGDPRTAPPGRLRPVRRPIRCGSTSGAAASSSIATPASSS
jgi:hypothetical protein